MADFKSVQRFVALVDEHNTRDDNSRNLPIVSLADRNFRIDQAMKKDDALRAYVEDYKVKNKKAVEAFDQAKELCFIEFLTNQDEDRVVGEIILVEFKGKELIRKPWILHRFLAWLEYRNNLAILLVAIISAGILAYIGDILRWLF
jgi:hypothetical protein